MTHRQVLEALSGLLLGMFVAILSSTIVSTALPKIIADLGGNQGAYTWVVTASLLTMTASTPLWGKLADLTSKKMLVQMALILFVLASAGAGLSQNTGTLITFRAIQGVGMGGLAALAQIIMAAMISPRERGRYSGYLGATFAVATVGGPLLGGVITDTSWLGWRWCFYVGVPFAIIALTVLQKTLRLPVVRRKNVKIDWAGSLFFAASVSLLLIWVTFAGDKYAWISWQTYAMVGGAIALALIFLLIESKAAEPIVPLRLFRNRTISLASFASLFVGVAMFGATVFLSQYFQLARGQSPTMAGMMTIPMIAGLFLSSTASGLIITRTGRWKVWLVLGGILMVAGCGLLGSIASNTEYWHVAFYMAALGLGVGMLMQNLVLCTQNQVAAEDLGATSSLVTFCRSLGGAIGVSALGAVLHERIKHYSEEGYSKLGIDPGNAPSGGGGGIPDLSKVPEPARSVIESAYGDGIADIYLYAAPIALVALLMMLFIKEVPLNTKSAMEQDGSEPNDGAAEHRAQGGEGAAVHAEAMSAAVRHAESLEAREVEASELARSVHASQPPQSGHHPQSAEQFGQYSEHYHLTPSGPSAGFGQPEPVSAMAASGGHDGSVGHDGSIGQHSSVGQHGFGSGDLSRETFAQAGTGPAAGPGSGGAGVPGAAIPLYGTVRDASGTGLPGAAVTLISLNGRQLGRSVTHPDGAYALDAPNAGSYVLIAAADRHQPQASTVSVGSEPMNHDILLSGTSGLAGVVRNEETGDAVSGAMVVVTDARGEVLASGSSGEQGGFRFDELVTGTFTVAVNAPGFRPTARPVEVSGQGYSRLEIDLSTGVRVRGTVLAGEERTPLPDARVTLVDASGNVVATASTGEDGAYGFSDLDAGEYSVIASGYPPVASALSVPGGGEEVNGFDIELHYPDE